MFVVYKIDTIQQVVKIKACHNFQSSASPSWADLEVETGGQACFIMVCMLIRMDKLKKSHFLTYGTSL